MLDNLALTDVAEHLRPEDFATEAHRVMFRAMLDLSARQSPIDEVSLVAHLKAQGTIEAAGGSLYAYELVEKTPTAANVTSYAQIVREASGVRALYLAARQAMKAIEEGDDASAVKEKLISMIATIDAREPSKLVDMRDELNDVLAEMVKRTEAGAAVSPTSFVSTGIGALDKMIVGCGIGLLVLLAARPRMGKTVLAENIGSNVALSGHRVMFFSAEMSTRSLARRTMASKAKIRHHKLRAGLFEDGDWAKATRAAGMFQPGRLLVDDQSPITMREIRARTLREHRRERLSLVVIDYAQKLKPESSRGNREQDVAQIARDLKDLAKIGVCVLALAQENQKVGDDFEARGNDRMLRESDTLFAEADVVLRLKRRYVFDKAADPRDAVIEICKQRDGEEGDVKLDFIGEHQRFEDPSPENHIVQTPTLGAHWTDLTEK